MIISINFIGFPPPRIGWCLDDARGGVDSNEFNEFNKFIKLIDSLNFSISWNSAPSLPWMVREWRPGGGLNECDQFNKFDNLIDYLTHEADKSQLKLLADLFLKGMSSLNWLNSLPFSIPPSINLINIFHLMKWIILLNHWIHLIIFITFITFPPPFPSYDAWMPQGVPEGRRRGGDLMNVMNSMSSTI